MNTGGDVALDDITVLPDSCYTEPPIDPPHGNNGKLKTLCSQLQTVIL